MANVDSNFGTRALKFFEYTSPEKIENARSYYKHSGVMEEVKKAGNELRTEEKKEADQKPAQQTKPNGLHAYDSFQSSEDSQPEHKIVGAKEMAAFMSGFSGVA